MKGRKTIWAIGNFPEIALSELRSRPNFELIVFSRWDEALAKLRTSKEASQNKSNQENETSELSSPQGLLIRTTTVLEDSHLDLLPHLKVVVTATSGFDHMDVATLTRRGVVLMHSPQPPVNAVRDLTFYFLLFASRGSFLSKHSNLERSQRPLGYELSGMTLGLVGLGRIGQAVSKLATTLGMEVLAYDPYQDSSAFTELGLNRSSYEEILKCSDVISFHVPKTSETEGMFSEKHMEVVSPHCFVINTSRGGIIQEQDLMKALDRGKLRGAALDVLANEPITKTDPLLSHPKVALTPHIGAYTLTTQVKSGVDAAQKIVRFFEMGEVSDSLPPQAAWYREVGSFKKSQL